MNTILESTRDRGEEMEKGEQHYRLLFEHMLTALARGKIILDVDGKPMDWTWVEVNPLFEQLTGLKDVVGKLASETVLGITESTSELLGIYGRVALTGKPERAETYLDSLKRWFLVSVYSDEKGFFTVVFDNITERKEKEEALRASEQHYRLLFEHMLTALARGKIILDVDGKPMDWTWVEVNPLFEQLTGLKDVVGKLASETVLGITESTSELLGIYGRVALTGKPERAETYLDSLKRWFLVSVYSDEKGFFTVVFDNITERKEKEEELRKNYALLDTIFDQSVSLMGLMHPDGTVIKINPTALNVIEGKESEIVGKLFWDTPWWAHSPEQQQRLRDAVKAASQGELVHFETTNRKANGELIYVDFSIKPVKDKNGNVSLLVPEGRDITERVKQEEELKLQKLQEFAIMDNIPDLVWMKDEAGVYLSVNKVLLSIIGKKREEVIGKTDLDIFSKGYADLYHAYDMEVIASGQQKRIEETIIDTKGKVIWIEVIKSPVYDTAGKLLGVAGIGRDITERRKVRSFIKKYIG